MKNKSIFFQIIILLTVSMLCVLSTIGCAFFFGSLQIKLFDFSNINFSNMIPVLIIGGSLSAFVVCITILFVIRSIFIKIKSDVSDDNKKTEDNLK